MELFGLVNRCAVIVGPKEPFWVWVHTMDKLHGDAMSMIREEKNMYLVPGFEKSMQPELAVTRFLKKNYQQIFLNELSEWYIDEDMYPKMTYKLFEQWFEISIATIIFDMVDKPLEKI